MLVSSKTYIKNGIKFKEYEKEKVSLSSAAPYISIFYCAALPSKRVGVAAEDIAREAIYGKIRFVCDYYVDKNVIWNVVPTSQAHITITLCDCSAPALQKILKLLQLLYQKRNFKQNELQFYFKNSQIETYLRDNLAAVGCEFHTEFEELVEETVAAKPCSCEVRQLEQWTSTPVRDYPIDSIRIVAAAPLKYRVHYYRSNWGAWVEQGKETVPGIIDGFQFVYEGDKQFSYRCGFKTKPTTKWTFKNMPLPYNIPITQFDCKIE